MIAAEHRPPAAAPPPAQTTRNGVSLRAGRGRPTSRRRAWREGGREEGSARLGTALRYWGVCGGGPPRPSVRSAAPPGEERGGGSPECGVGSASPRDEDSVLRRELLLTWGGLFISGDGPGLALSSFYRGIKGKPRRGSGCPAGWERHGLKPLLLKP